MLILEIWFQFLIGNLLANAFYTFSLSQLKINFWPRFVLEKEQTLIFLEKNTQVC